MAAENESPSASTDDNRSMTDVVPTPSTTVGAESTMTPLTSGARTPQQTNIGELYADVYIYNLAIMPCMQCIHVEMMTLELLSKWV